MELLEFLYKYCLGQKLLIHFFYQQCTKRVLLFCSKKHRIDKKRTMQQNFEKKNRLVS